MWGKDIYIQLWSSNGNIHGVMRTQLCKVNNAGRKKKKQQPWTCLSASALTMVQWAQHSLSHPAVKHPNENKQEDGGRQVAKVEKHELRNMNFYDSIKHNFFESSSHKQRKIMFCYLQSWLPCYSAPFWDFRRRKKANMRRISALMQCTKHCYATSKQAKEQRLSQNCQTKGEQTRMLRLSFHFSPSFSFCSLST